MTYDRQLAERMRQLLADHPVREQVMFGGLAFLITGRIAVAASTDGGLLIRVDSAQADEFVRTTAAKAVQMRGRTMRGWLHVDGEHLHSDLHLGDWLDVGVVAATSSVSAP